MKRARPYLTRLLRYGRVSLFLKSCFGSGKKGMDLWYNKTMEKRTTIKLNTRRDPRLDILRGVTLVSMIVYHGCWDLVYLLGFDWDWYKGTGAWLWQQSICWTFILLSGYCWSMGRHHLKRGLMTFGAGLLVSLVTIVAMPSSMILCGVLTLLGSAALFMILLDPVLRRVDWRVGLALSFLLFFVFRSVNQGWLGLSLGGKIGGIALVELPKSLYQMGLIGAWIGFMPRGFFSTDYFSMLPWFFLFCAGYFLRKKTEAQATGRPAASQSEAVATGVQGILRKVLQWMGRHSLLVYLIHQPALYGLCVVLQLLM